MLEVNPDNVTSNVVNVNYVQNSDITFPIDIV
jgi:hypothetical protein